jgi:hypothetical protein
MVNFQQRIVFAPEVERRVDHLLHILNAFNQKLTNVEPALASVQPILAKAKIVSARVDYTVYRVDGLIRTVHMLGIFMALVFLFLVVLVVLNMVLCYLVWKRVWVLGPMESGGVSVGKRRR